MDEHTEQELRDKLLIAESIHERATERLLKANKAAEYSKVQGLINQACLNVESDYVPDWSRFRQVWWPSYCRIGGEWEITEGGHETPTGIIYQSTEAKCQQVCDILNDIKLKPVGVK